MTREIRTQHKHAYVSLSHWVAPYLLQSHMLSVLPGTDAAADNVAVKWCGCAVIVDDGPRSHSSGFNHDTFP